jgi:hypothetical protein
MNYTMVRNSSVSYAYDKLKNMTIIIFMISNPKIEFGVSEELYIPYVTYRYGEKNLKEIAEIVCNELSWNELELEENLIHGELDTTEVD